MDFAESVLAREGDSNVSSCVEITNKIRAKFDALPSPEVSSLEISRIPKGQGHIGRVLDWTAQKKVFGEYKNDDTGEIVKFSRRGVRNIYTHGSNDKKLALMEKIPSLIKNGILLEITKKNDLLDSQIFASKATIDDEPYAVSYVVRSDANGKRYYDHGFIKTTALDQLNDQAPLSDGRNNQRIHATTTTSSDNSAQEPLINILKKHLAVNSQNLRNADKTPAN